MNADLRITPDGAAVRIEIEWPPVSVRLSLVELERLINALVRAKLALKYPTDRPGPGEQH